MDKNLMILITITASIAVIIVLVILLKKFSGISSIVSKVSTKASEVYDVAKTLGKVISPFLPNPLNTYAEMIFQFADKAVNVAEEAWKAGNCEEEERKETAVKMIEDLLQNENVELDEKTERLVDVATEVMVTTLAKSHA